MIRKMIKIDADKCNGCGLCINACHEGALELINGKAVLVSDSYCDGLGACLPECPTGAMILEDREAAAFDEVAVQKRMDAMKAQETAPQQQACGCPGMSAKVMNRQNTVETEANNTTPIQSQLRQWPCQLKLVAVNAPFFDNAKLLIAADCSAFAYANLHNEFMKNRITLIGCPKLDDINYADKLAAILQTNNIQSVDVVRMSVPCCGGLVSMVKEALGKSGKVIPWQVITIGTDGVITDRS